MSTVYVNAEGKVLLNSKGMAYTYPDYATKPIDGTVTEGSENLIESGAVWTALNGKSEIVTFIYGESTFSEIQEASDAGKNIKLYARDYDCLLDLTSIKSNEVMLTAAADPAEEEGEESVEDTMTFGFEGIADGRILQFFIGDVSGWSDNGGTVLIDDLATNGDVVRLSEQDLMAEQKAQARININAADDSKVVKITSQTLQSSDQIQACKNIGAARAEDVDNHLSDIDQNVGTDCTSDMISGYAINVGYASVGDTIDTTPVANSAVKCILIKVKSGYSLILTGTGASNPRLWAFLDSDKKLLSMAAASASATSMSLLAPEDGYLIVNSLVSVTTSIKFKGIKDDIDLQIAEISKEYDVFSSAMGWYISKVNGLLMYNSALTDKSTPFLPVKPGIEIFGCTGTNQTRVAFYDETFKFISADTTITQGANVLLTLTSDNIPSTAKYFRATGNVSSSNAPYVKGLTPAMAVSYSRDYADLLSRKGIVNLSDILFPGYTIASNQAVGEVVDITSRFPNANYGCAAIRCHKGDVYRITGTGASTFRLWAFLDSDCKMVSSAKAALNAIDNLIVSPSDGYVIINIDMSRSYHLTLDSVTRDQTSFGKSRWLAMGDSITQGYYSYYTSSEDEEGSSSFDENHTWVRKVSTIKGWTLDNQAIGGEGWNDPADLEHGARARVDTIDFSNADIVSIAYGINDYKGDQILGSMQDDIATTYSVVANMRYVIEKIIASNPLCKIIIITPLNARGYYGARLGDESTNYAIGHQNAKGDTLEDYFNAMVEVCKYYGLQYIDMTHRSIINRKNMVTTLPDGVHPSEAAHTLIARQLSEELTCY